MKSRIFLLLLGTIFFLKANACDCKDGFSEFTPVYLSEYNHIKICQPFAADTLNDIIHYRAIVTKNYWGVQKDTITIGTHFVEGACGFPLKLNSTYLLYGKGSSAIFYISACSPQRELLSASGLEGFANNEDSIVTNINFIKKFYTWKHIVAFRNKADKNEIETLEKLLVSKDTITTYFADGTVSGKFMIKDGKLNGPSQFYYPSGLLYSKGNFVNGEKEAMWNEYTFKIKRKKEFYLQEAGNYKEGTKKGAWKGKMLKGTVEEYSAGLYNFQLDHNYDK